MQVSLEWLNEYVDISDITPEQIAHELTMSGLEVEDIEKIEAKFTNIVVAEILSLKPHPDADKLRLVTIFNGSETREVVCGAQNIAEGQLIPYASVGSKVLDRKSGEQFELKPAVIRGVESQGMLCSADELGLENSTYQDEDGILILNRFLKDIKPGQDVKEVLGIKTDSVLNVAPTANRGDEMSIVGIARELCAIFNKNLKFSYLENASIKPLADFALEIIDEDTCKYYSLAVLKDLKIKPAPSWMSRRLQACGVRSINNVVDITNYVMLEYGQPLHSFDFDKLNNNYLCVRRAKVGEKIKTLDEVERNLNNDSVLIATKERGVAIAGVMGDYTSEIDETTKNVALESAYFTAPTNRRNARSVGLRTDACARFERGVDIEGVKPALIRAIQLLVEYADAKIEGISETGNNKLPDLEITLRFNQIKRILGIEIPVSKCCEILSNLGFTLLGQNEIAAKFKVPSYRINDVTREIDLIEEISRIYGYDKIEPTLPSKTVSPVISQEQVIVSKINQIFLGYGFNEAVTSSILGEPILNWFGIDYDKQKAVKVTNPQSEEHTMLRQSLIPSIAQVVKYNFDKGEKNIWLYEIGKTFFFNGNPTEKSSDVEEKRIIAGAISGSIQQNQWLEARETDFYTLKGILESLFKDLGIEKRLEYKPLVDTTYFHPGRSAEIFMSAKQPISIGKFGQLHPAMQERCKFSQTAYIFEIDLEQILANVSKSTVKYKELPQYQSVTRDMAFIVSKEVSNQDISRTITRASSKLLQKAEIFDVYEGEHVEAGKKSVAYRYTIQDIQSTLTDEQVDAEIAKIKQGLQKAYPDLSFRE